MAWNLERFIRAQEPIWHTALNEITTGRKRSHWMWFIFPQLRGLGSSWMANEYSLSGLEEAEAYWQHPVLRARLYMMCEALMVQETSNARDIFDFPDNLKLCSCMTLFAHAAPEEEMFRRVLDKFFEGREDEQTLWHLSAGPSSMGT